VYAPCIATVMESEMLTVGPQAKDGSDRPCVKKMLAHRLRAGLIGPG